jgi:hypothetical protein
MGRRPVLAGEGRLGEAHRLTGQQRVPLEVEEVAGRSDAGGHAPVESPVSLRPWRLARGRGGG